MSPAKDQDLDMTPHCAAGVDHRRRIRTLEDQQVKIWEIIDKLRNRLPHWATLLIAILMAIIGYLAKGLAQSGS